MGDQDAVGKTVKGIPLLIVLIFGMIFRCELFHQTIVNETDAYFPSAECRISEKELSGFRTDVSAAGAFVVSCRSTKTARTLTVYTDSTNVRKALKHKGIAEGGYRSLFSGTTEIRFRPLSSLTFSEYLETGRISFLSAVQVEHFAGYEVGSPEIMQTTETDMIFIVWGLIAALTVILNGAAVLASRKEALLREIYGERATDLVRTSMVFDILRLEGLYFAARLSVMPFMSGDYHPLTAFFLYQVGVLAAVLLNLTYLKTDFRAVFADTTGKNGGLLPALYFLKYAVTIVLLLSLSTSLTRMEDLKVLRGSALEQYFDKGIFVTLSEGGETGDCKDRIWQKLWLDHSKEAIPFVDLNIGPAGHPILIMNREGGKLLPDIDGFQRDGDQIQVLFPEKKPLAEGETESLLGLVLDSADRHYQRISYREELAIPCLSGDEDSPVGTASDPVIIYCPDILSINDAYLTDGSSVLYECMASTFRELVKTVNPAHDAAGDRITNGGEYLRLKTDVARQMLRFLTSFCVLIVVIDLAVLAVIGNLEFRFHGMEYALKKVSGYSLFERYRRLLFMNNIINLVLAAIILLGGALSGMTHPGTVLLSFFIIEAGENASAAAVITRLEKTAIPKILKGGCL